MEKLGYPSEDPWGCWAGRDALYCGYESLVTPRLYSSKHIMLTNISGTVLCCGPSSVSPSLSCSFLDT